MEKPAFKNLPHRYVYIIILRTKLLTFLKKYRSMHLSRFWGKMHLYRFFTEPLVLPDITAEYSYNF